ncbi:MAG: hypothetical protein FJ279_28925 [Planctomycetes bacterium]|nr:hypothetical protein [Planctomycetota bacterium]
MTIALAIELALALPPYGGLRRSITSSSAIRPGGRWRFSEQINRKNIVHYHVVNEPVIQDPRFGSSHHGPGLTYDPLWDMLKWQP